MRQRWTTRGIALVLFLAPGAQGAGPGDALEPPPFDEFLVIPLRVHLLRSDDLPEVNCRLTDEDLTRIVRKVNGIWQQAGIHWGLESLTREPPARPREYRLARDLEGPDNLAIFRRLVPDRGRDGEGLHVYYLHKFPVNGVWMGDDFAIVQETARLREVEGGIDEPVPRVTSHELGHALGLPHRQDRTNLLASGTTGTLLNATEVSTARRNARKVPGTRSVADLQAAALAAEAAGQTSRALKFSKWLAAIPGAGDGPGAQVERLEAEIQGAAAKSRF